MSLVYVAIGSALGGVSRVLLSGFVQARTVGTFPLGTLLVNVTGAFLLGFLARASLGAEGLSPPARLLLTAGFCGGYTTFSTFSLEALQLLEQGDYARAGGYMLGSVVLALGATIAGVTAARAITS